MTWGSIAPTGYCLANTASFPLQMDDRLRKRGFLAPLPLLKEAPLPSAKAKKSRVSISSFDQARLTLLLDSLEHLAYVGSGACG